MFWPQDDPRPCVFHHVFQALWRVEGIERNVGGTRFENAKQARYHLERPLSPDSDPRLRAHSQPTELPRDPVGAPVELSVSPFASAEGQRHGARIPLHLRFEQLLDHHPRVGTLRPVPFHDHLLPFLISENREVTDALLRILHRRLEQRPVMAQHPFRHGRLKQVGVVFERDLEAIFLFDEDRQVEFRETRVQFVTRDLQLRVRKVLRRAVLENEHRLEKGRATEATLKVEGFDEFFKR